MQHANHAKEKSMDSTTTLRLSIKWRRT
jgi:hypothetical protein